ncbi:hypothetical protein C4J96_4584 [Pseudomonas orientalis]|uniref:hypothetical protein n=1 Tax=Pseudomonas orientalis TaxID=76758 RepID=UPI000F575D9C|nr:hypothetical protein [Pseudomonas orientalis]AZE96662.1 hypothetical protein C4J96_4584 [Pseudomonas orientalis]
MSHPKNSTALSDTQYPDQGAPELAPKVAAIVPEDKWLLVAELLAAERNHASTWWTILNEMHFRNLLPEWAVKMGAGSHPSWDKWDADCRASNLALLAFDGHLNAIVHPIREFAPQSAQSENVAREMEVQP